MAEPARERLHQIATTATRLADHDEAALAVYEDIPEALDLLECVEADLNPTEDA